MQHAPGNRTRPGFMAASIDARSVRMPWPLYVVCGIADTPFTHTVDPGGARTHTRANPYASPADAVTRAANGSHTFAAGTVKTADANTVTLSPLSSDMVTGTPAAAACR